MDLTELLRLIRASLSGLPTHRCSSLVIAAHGGGGGGGCGGGCGGGRDGGRDGSQQLPLTRTRWRRVDAKY